MCRSRPLHRRNTWQTNAPTRVDHALTFDNIDVVVVKRFGHTVQQPRFRTLADIPVLAVPMDRSDFLLAPIVKVNTHDRLMVGIGE